MPAADAGPAADASGERNAPSPQATLAVLRRALAGEVAVVLPRDRGGELRVVDPASFDPAGTGREHPALVLFTSGSTGAPKAVALPAAALTASARATERFLAGPGRWYLTLPDNHIAGVQVLLRSILAGTEPVVAQGRFTAEAFAADVGRMTVRAEEAAGSEESGGRRSPAARTPLYTSLVPTQLVRIMADPRAQDAARAFDAILLGGSAISPALLTAAQAAGLRIVRTYGMSETCGGCVYDGHPFDEVAVTIEDGRVALAGPVVADGYLRVEDSDHGLRLIALPDAGTGFGHTAAGDRSFLTSDLGRLDAGVLEILGRADDVIITGGENVSPHAVENALLAVLEPHGIAEVLVTSVPDPEWGEALVALLSPAAGAKSGDRRTGGVGTGVDAGTPPEATPGPGTGTVSGAGASTAEQLTEQVRDLAADTLPRHALPRHVYAVDSLPVRSIGKPDRAAARRLAGELLGPT